MKPNVGFRMDFFGDMLPQNGWWVARTSERIGYGVLWTRELGNALLRDTYFVVAIPTMLIAYAGDELRCASAFAQVSVICFLGAFYTWPRFAPNSIVFLPDGRMSAPLTTWDRRSRRWSLVFLCVGCVLTMACAVTRAWIYGRWPSLDGCFVIAFWLAGSLFMAAVAFDVMGLARATEAGTRYVTRWTDILGVEYAQASQWDWRASGPDDVSPYDVYFLMADGGRFCVVRTYQSRQFVHKLTVLLNQALGEARLAYSHNAGTTIDVEPVLID